VTKDKNFFIGDIHYDDASILSMADAFRARMFGLAKSDIEAYNNLIVSRLTATMQPNRTVWIMGDLGRGWEEFLDRLPKLPLNIMIGNHDDINGLFEYSQNHNHIKIVKNFSRVNKYWLSHIPIHPQELYNKKNIHGHCHTKSVNSANYINVSVDCCYGWPVPMSAISNEVYRTGIGTITNPADPVTNWLKLKENGYYD
jgi:calcineurin-like phosphoesterase family protein